MSSTTSLSHYNPNVGMDKGEGVHSGINTVSPMVGLRVKDSSVSTKSSVD
jgi:hypothetical protein